MSSQHVLLLSELVLRFRMLDRLCLPSLINVLSIYDIDSFAT